jgi:hypothetical protein
MGMNKKKVRTPKPEADGLITSVTSALEATGEAPSDEARPSPNDTTSTSPSSSAATAGPSLAPSDPPREKCGWYLPPSVIDDVRDAVDALRQRDLRIDGKVVDAGRLVEDYIRKGLDELYESVNSGKRFPVSPGTRAIRAKRKR